jgi:hypothetical protein
LTQVLAYSGLHFNDTIRNDRGTDGRGVGHCPGIAACTFDQRRKEHDTGASVREPRP